MKRLLFLSLMLMLGLTASAQNDENAQDAPAEELSAEEIAAATDDTYFIDHTVTLGEKIIMVSKKYMVDPQDIYEFNDVANGVEAGFVLKIPLHKSHKKDLEGFKELLIKKNGGQSIKVAAPEPRKREEVELGDEDR